MGEGILDDGRALRIIIPLTSVDEQADLRDEVIQISISDGWGNAFEMPVDLSAAGFSQLNP